MRATNGRPYRGTVQHSNAAQNFHRTIGKRQFHGFFCTIDTGLPQYAYP